MKVSCFISPLARNPGLLFGTFPVTNETPCIPPTPPLISRASTMFLQRYLGALGLFLPQNNPLGTHQCHCCHHILATLSQAQPSGAMLLVEGVNCVSAQCIAETSDAQHYVTCRCQVKQHGSLATNLRPEMARGSTRAPFSHYGVGGQRHPKRLTHMAMAAQSRAHPNLCCLC